MFQETTYRLGRKRACTLIRKFLLTDCVHSKLRLSGLLHLVLKSVFNQVETIYEKRIYEKDI